jgi:ribonuclease HII
MCDAHAIVKGDAKCLSIAAASIVAKVTRDRIMAEADSRFPGYGWTGHKGYPTKAHREAVETLGRSPAHRWTFGQKS